MPIASSTNTGRSLFVNLLFVPRTLYRLLRSASPPRQNPAPVGFSPMPTRSETAPAQPLDPTHTYFLSLHHPAATSHLPSKLYSTCRAPPVAASKNPTPLRNSVRRSPPLPAPPSHAPDLDAEYPRPRHPSRHERHDSQTAALALNPEATKERTASPPQSIISRR